MKVAETPKELSKRIHLDWWGYCRSCHFWKTNDPERFDITNTKCGNINSPMFDENTWTEGKCDYWDSYDTDTAIEVMEDDERKFRNI